MHLLSTTLRNCARGEAESRFSPPQAAVSRAMVVSAAEKRRDLIPIGKVKRGERKQTADEASKSGLATSKPMGVPSWIGGPS